MFPLRDTQKSYSKPVVTVIIIVINILVFLYEFSLNEFQLNHFIATWGLVPDRFAISHIFTSMFLHGGWLHVLGNMLFLWVFGRNVEDHIGGMRYLGLYLTCGVIAAIVQVIANPYSRVPTIGASGAIAGIMGAYLIRFPRTTIHALFFLIFILFLDIPAPWLLLYWFGIQFLSGVGSLGQTDFSGGGVAWFAHIGGFIAGMLLIRFFPDRRRWRYWYSEE